MKRQEIEKLIDERIAADASRHFGITMEFFNDQFATVYEGHQNLMEMMERMSGDFKLMSDDFKVMKGDINQLKMGVFSLDNRVSKLEKNYEHA